MEKRKLAKLLSITIVVSFFSIGSYADMWTMADTMAFLRVNHTATLLSKGKVLAVGGQSAIGTYLSSCELYDTATGWTVADSMLARRIYHTANLLLNGTVIVTGGRSGGGGGNYFSICEIYDPIAGIWDTTDGRMNTARALHTATLLSKGKLLVTGGYNGIRYLQTCELFDTTTKTWSLTDSMSIKREYHTANLLPDGSVLVTGGDSGMSASFASCEIYDPTAGTWSITDSMNTPRRRHTATLLTNGKVLIAGGINGTIYTPSCELYDPVAGTFDSTGAMAIPRVRHKAILLQDGRVLVVGGDNSSGAIDVCEIYDPISETWSITDTLNIARRSFDASLLLDGRVLAVGGYEGANYLASCELYKPPAALVNLNIVSPNGGEVWNGPQGLVEWKCSNPSALDHFTLLYTINASGITVTDDSISSAHPYTANYDSTWTIIRTGATKIFVHFDTLFTESGYDFVIIYGSNGDSVTSYSGVHSEFWTPEVLGDTVKIRLITDNMTNCYGFDIDRDSADYSGVITWDTVAASVMPTDTEYLWTLPIVNSSVCRVKILAIDSLDNPIVEDESDSNFTIMTVGIEDKPLIKLLGLSGNYPNPFNNETTIRLTLPKSGNVNLNVFNVIGQKVTTLLSGYKKAGEYTIKWKGNSDNGRKVPSGIYFYRLESGKDTAVRKMYLVR